MEEYYEFLDKSGVGVTYDWTSFNISLNFNKEDIDLDSIFAGEKSFEGSNNEMLFIHEYVHFLQNFYTNWGGLVFCHFVLGVNKLAASRGEDDSVITLPLKLEKRQSQLWNDGIEILEKFKISLSTDEGNIRFEETNLFPDYKISELTNEKLEISNGRILYTINNKTIREHMAELSACLFTNLNDVQIHDRFSRCNAFSSGNSIMDKEPMYWFLFEYFYAKSFTNIAEALVKLAHSALCTANPKDVISRFFIFLEANSKQINNSNLILFVNTFLLLPAEIIAFSFSHHASLKKISDFLILCNKHKDQSFYQFAEKIYYSLLINISQTQSSKKFFENPVTLRNKDNWLQIIKYTGTPIIRYKDKRAVINIKNGLLVDSFTYFLGMIKVFYNLQTQRNQCCPFFEEFNICRVDYKNAETCFHDALNVRNPLNNNEECLHQNAVELMGLKDRLRIN